MEFEAINVGFLSILPPIIAIGLALITKEVISSLFIGTIFGVFTYAFSSDLGFIGAITTLFQLMGNKIGGNAMMILFLSFLGVIVVLVTSSGGAEAYGKWATTKIKNRTVAQLATSLLGIIIFIDDYFNCLTVGTVMKPITDRYRISRAKLAYLIDSTAAPVCIISPISSWAAAVGSTLAGAAIFDSEIMAFISTIPFNLYALLTLLMIIIISVFKINYGPMKKAEERALNENVLGAVNKQFTDSDEIETTGKISYLIVPILALIIFSVLAMLYTGKYFAETKTIAAAFGDCDSSLSLVLGGFGAIVVTFALYVPKKVISFKGFMASVTEGIQLMIPAIIILVLAWSLSGVCRDLLSTGNYVGHLVEVSNVPLAIIPLIVFIVSAFLSFATGTAWGTFGILIPIVISIAGTHPDPKLLTVALAATLGGSVFGDHCSPISDTTILSSTGADCDHIEHVSTQIPYALTVATSCAVGYIVSAITSFNLIATLVSSIAVLIILIYVINKISIKKEMKNETMTNVA
ncbi:MAG: Na+/H+ antiporter NhaC family protein [Eubacteriales bacterium]|nr:Na+/H+ antiporter NhaC family protein [Eubacteriales bacterium]MDY3332950.1 Na+/H+ antiporter NhaC family protein [Gallibacter sp.]